MGMQGRIHSKDLLACPARESKSGYRSTRLYPESRNQSVTCQCRIYQLSVTPTYRWQVAFFTRSRLMKRLEESAHGKHHHSGAAAAATTTTTKEDSDGRQDALIAALTAMVQELQAQRRQQQQQQ